ncbi:MAG: hypothetical protein ACYTFA_06990 [Planctomycetota bacterium]|jgi:predicted RNase H-like HicB family nuclease
MSPLLQFPILIYPSEDSEGGEFTAHCLSMDLLADGDTVEGAVSELLESIEAALEAAQKHNANVFRRAPEEYWDKLARAQALPTELAERIVFNSNKRRSPAVPPLIDVEKQCEMRQLQVA